MAEANSNVVKEPPNEKDGKTVHTAVEKADKRKNTGPNHSGEMGDFVEDAVRAGHSGGEADVDKE